MDLPDARTLSPDALELLRRIAVRAVVDLNMSHKEVASLLCVGQNAVGKWCAAYREGGEDALNVQPQGRPMGTGRSLTPSEEKILQAIILDATPEVYGLPFSTWTRRAVQALIWNRYGIDLSEQGVGNYLQRWKMSPQKPARHAREQDPDEVREFEEQTLPETEKKAEKEGGQLHFADETGSKVQDQIGTSYAPIGQTPVLEVPKTRIQQNLISSVTPSGEMTYRLFFRNHDREQVYRLFRTTDCLDSPENISCHRPPSGSHGQGRRALGFGARRRNGNHLAATL